MTQEERNRRRRERSGKDQTLTGLRRVTARACGVGFVPVVVPTTKEMELAPGMSALAVAEIRKDIWRHPVWEYSARESGWRAG